MSERGVSYTDEGILTSPVLHDEAASMGNYSLGDHEPVLDHADAILKLLGYFWTEDSTGDTCHRVKANKGGYCTCAFQLACVLDMPGETLLSQKAMTRALDMLSMHKDEKVADLARKLLDRNFREGQEE